MTPIEKLLGIMAALRDPAHGCPWDREQNFETIAPYTIEEAYEVADAISRGDMSELRDELGDLLFQVVFHAHLGSEQGDFDFNDVANAISDKLERRHPHVFAGEDIGSARDQSLAWEAHKMAERAARQQNRAASVLDAVHAGRPALQRATELQQTAAAHGFDWPDAASVLPKLHEELGELESALEQHGAHGQAVEELGDLLFTCVNLARHLQVDAEATLRAANTKFESRFRRLEQRVLERGMALQDATLAELDALWESAKRDDGKKTTEN